MWLPVIKITVKSMRFAGENMSKELSLNRISNRVSSSLKEGVVHERVVHGNVYDLELELLRRKREEAIKRIIEDSKSLKW